MKPPICAGCGSRSVTHEVMAGRIWQPDSIRRRVLCTGCWLLYRALLDASIAAVGSNTLHWKAE